MSQTLRNTHVVQQRNARLLNAWRQVRSDPAISAVWNHMRLLLAEMYEVEVAPLDHADQRAVDDVRKVLGSQADNFEVSVGIFVDLIRERIPAIEGFLGPRLPFWISGALAFTVTGDVSYLSQLDRTHYVLPGNPLTIAPNDGVHGGEHAPREDFLKLADYYNALRPAHPRGRPKKGSARPQPPRQQGIDPARAAHAALAYNNSQDGIRWTATARQVFSELNLSDTRQKEIARKRVDRLIYQGEKLAKQALIPHPPQKKLDA